MNKNLFYNTKEEFFAKAWFFHANLSFQKLIDLFSTDIKETDQVKCFEQTLNLIFEDLLDINSLNIDKILAKDTDTLDLNILEILFDDIELKKLKENREKEIENYKVQQGECSLCARNKIIKKYNILAKEYMKSAMSKKHRSDRYCGVLDLLMQCPLLLIASFAEEPKAQDKETFTKDFLIAHSKILNNRETNPMNNYLQYKLLRIYESHIKEYKPKRNDVWEEED